MEKVTRVADALDLYNSTPTDRRRQLADALRKTGLLGITETVTEVTEPVTSPLQKHGNTYHTATFITATDVTFENLNANSDVGSAATQVAIGNHTHAAPGSDTYILFNDSGAIGTDSDLSWNKTTNILSLNGTGSNSGSISIAGLQALSKGKGNLTGNIFVGAGGGANASHGSGSEGYYNCSLGDYCLASVTTGYQNVALGYYGLNALSTGRGNFSLGLNVLRSSNADFNIGIGVNVFYNNSSGGNNTGIGAGCGYWNQTGVENCGIGYQSMGYGAAALNSFSRNTVIGSYAGWTLKTASDNTFIGYKAAYALDITGAYNTIIGQSAMYAATGATSSNTIIGYQGGHDLTTAIKNTFIGTDAGHKFTTGGSNVCIGYAAGPTAVSVSSNLLYIHNAASDTPLIQGDFSTGLVTINSDLKTTKFGVGLTPIARRAHVADPSAGTVQDAEARSAINSILSTLEAFGFHEVA